MLLVSTTARYVYVIWSLASGGKDKGLDGEGVKRMIGELYADGSLNLGFQLG